MGIIVEIDRSRARFTSPGTGPIGFDLDKNFRYEMHSWEIEFGVRFEADPSVGIGGAPNGEESWRLGIVQIVLYGRMLFVYEDADARKPPQRLEREVKLPEIDVLPGSTEYPFYADQRVTPNALVTRPVAHIEYSSKGYREKGAKSSMVDNAPSTFNMWDQPESAVPFRKDQSFRLRRLEKVLIFQAWLVAMKTGQFSTGSPMLDKVKADFIPKILRQLGESVVTLAAVPAFATTFWAEFDLPRFRPQNSIDTPNFTWGLYGSEGFITNRAINRSITELGPAPFVKPVKGNGGRFPVVTGPPSIQGSENWFKANGFHL